MSKEICRLCLCECNLRPIFFKKDKCAEYIIALEVATGLRIEPNDGLPQHICNNCTFLVSSALKLRNQSHAAEIKLTSTGYKRKHNNPSIIEEISSRNDEISKKIEERKTGKRNCNNSSNIIESTSRSNDIRKQPEENRIENENEHINQLITINNEDNFHNPENVFQNNESTCQNFSPLLQCEENNILNVDDVYFNEENKLLNIDVGFQDDETFSNFENRSNDCYDFNGFKIQVEFDRVSESGGKNREAKKNRKQPIKNKDASFGKKSELYLNLVEGKLDPKGPVKCKVCKTTVSKWACFTNHAKKHLGFKFVCEFCGKSFISSTQLKRHCMSFHGMKRELKCQHCSYFALDNAQLRVHERRVHTGIRPYVCAECSASYYSRKCLVQHIESHSATATIQCELCPSVFKSRRHLAKHKYGAHRSGRRRIISQS